MVWGLYGDTQVLTVLIVSLEYIRLHVTRTMSTLLIQTTKDVCKEKKRNTEQNLQKDLSSLDT